MGITQVTKRSSGLAAVWISLLLAGFTLAGCRTGQDKNFADVPGLPGSAATAPAAAPAESAAPAGAAPASGTNGGYSVDIVHIGDTLIITFQDLPIIMPPIEDRVKDDGTITLLFTKTFTAAGKTRGQLEREIRDAYVPAFYKAMTVSVRQQIQTQFYYVGGEVKIPGRQVYIGRITVLKAIQSCGDFTDFANRRKVQLTRADGRTITINANKALKDAKMDLEIFPNDKIYVPRRVLW